MHLSRADFFASLFIIGCANGLAGKIIASANLRGWTNAAFGTFDISVIVVVSCIAGTLLMLRSAGDEVRSGDIAVGVVLFLFMILPIAATAWLAVRTQPDRTLIRLVVVGFCLGPGRCS